ncbi:MULTISPECIES: GTPase HflX [Aerococcus]|uniref:GTPase HflX n=1 Tax=Aerococcus TaxID=1375 RepID=UPI000DCF1DDB|nr:MULTISPECIES: GTPase HflX [Aerococcus]KAA9234345.1 GTPase HflX [Aerococcus mictus]MBU5610379.1 GTPase HflX [Aerococcus urinae]MDK6291529.1 GTPase HflX [Aerococcus urinae]MDK8388951.1 GTPase HflX [Aerococcus urinae]MDK8483878.1 GTPase HflX [Aerococcus urinae]
MPENVLIIGLQLPQTTDLRFTMQMDELAALVETAGGQVVSRQSQKRDQEDARYLIGSGKVREIHDLSQELDIDLVIFYQQLSPSQNRNLQEAIDCPVIDRVQLILDIFASRATSKEGKLQVALAQNEYLLPRLAGMGTVLSRLGGGIGTRGPGETKLEQDRRVLRNEIQKIRHELKEVEKQRELTRERRQKSGLFKNGLLGYTNAGKSTLINALTDAQTYQADQLFATLTPLTRKFSLPNHFEITLTDTVGFIQDLPPMIIDAFHSTLEESRNVDLLMIVVDASSAFALEQEAVVNQLLDDLDMQDLPKLYIYNKRDQVESDQEVLTPSSPHLLMSAQDSQDIEALRQVIIDQVKTIYQPFAVQVAPQAANEWLGYQNRFYIEKFEFDRESESYQIMGYKPDYLPLPKTE